MVAPNEIMTFRGELIDGVLYDRLGLRITEVDLDIFFVWSASACGEIPRNQYQGVDYDNIRDHPLYGKRNELTGCHLAIGTKKIAQIIGEEE